jgi:hypothetical protein
MKRNVIKAFATLLIILSSTFAVLADDPGAPPDPGGDPSVDPNGQPVGAPIDGGLSVLLALGAGYGGFKLYRSRKDKEATETEE